MAAPLLIRNRNYRLLFGAGALTNLGDGMVALALPWLATLLTRDPVAIAAVAAAGRAPWLLFSIPAGVVIDRHDRRKLVARADLLRMGLVTAILLLALGPPVAGAIWALAGLAFLLGSAEVVRDNAAQTLLPSIVEGADLERANSQMWSVEQLTGQFIGPPLAGLLIGVGIGFPFGMDAAALGLAAGLVWAITLPPVAPIPQRFWEALTDGIRFMRGDRLLLRLALALGVSNFLASAVITVQVLFAQDVLGLTPAQYGAVLSVEAAGAILGSLSAPLLVRRFGVNLCLTLAVATWGAATAVAGVSQNGAVLAVALACVLFAAMVWNVITVSWRQRRIPAPLLGRVNSIYRFFGWGSMPLGALAGGIIVTLAQGFGAEAALRLPFLLAAAGYGVLTVFALTRLRLGSDLDL